METSSSLSSSALRPGAVQKSSTASCRLPFGPAMLQVAPSATITGIESPLGAALHRLPPSEARPWICVPPISVAASIRPA